MEMTQIIEELAYDMGVLPREAIEAAIVKQAQITPLLLNILKDAIDRVDEIIEDDNYQAHLYALYLLAQFREEEAFPLVIQLFSFPGEIPHAIAGDILTEDLSRILASVCGKDILLLKEMIENPSINEYVRAVCVTTLVILVGCGSISRDLVLEYFRSLLVNKLEKRSSFVWDNLIASCCLLYPQEIYEEIAVAFEQSLVDRDFISIQDVCAALKEEKTKHLLQLHQTTELIDDTVAEMEKWLAHTYVPHRQNNYDSI